MKLTDFGRLELRALINNPKYGSSNRERDRARAKLKRLGMIRFDRKSWQWEVLQIGRAALADGGRDAG